MTDIADNSGRCLTARATHEPNPQAVSAVPVGIANASGIDIVDLLRFELRDWDGKSRTHFPSINALAIQNASDEIVELRGRLAAAEAAQLNLVRRAEHFRNGGIERAAHEIEELSKRPSTQWGEIVRAIRALKEEERDD